MTLNYKDYIGSAEMSLEDNVLHGKLLFIRDLVTYVADSPAELQVAFEAAVDEYLADCIEFGREADRPCKGQFNLRITPDLHRELAVCAMTSGKKLNDYVSNVLSCHKNLIGAEQHHRATQEALFVSAKIVMAHTGVHKEVWASSRTEKSQGTILRRNVKSKWAENSVSKAYMDA